MSKAASLCTCTGWVLCGRPMTKRRTRWPEVVDKLGAELQVASIRRQGGLGSYLRVRLAAWFRALVNRRLAVRWLLIIFGLPLLPVIMVFGGIFVVATVVLDFFVRSARYWVSALILASNDSGRP